ncbi:MAG: hypothetical protein J6Q11_06375, partial [Fibrobacteraceae bacterium]|nr:hypothetical protein [Fibrobacteraceae bacterium]
CPRTLSLQENLPENLVIAMERSDRSNLFASRSPHYVRDDNLYCVRDDKPELAHGSCPRTLSLRAVQKARRGNLFAINTCFWITSLRS